MITVILNGYKRKDQLSEQYAALSEQTLKPDEILLWYNYPESGDINTEVGTLVPSAYCNYNFGVWARFAFAFMAKSEYVCIFDDDTIPGKKWLENCMTTMQKKEGLLGTIGLLYNRPSLPSHPNCSYYEPYTRYGWANPNPETMQVDLVGHSWFFKKEWLSEFWKEQPDSKYNICGEDMHFSYMLQKYRNIPTYVPPHPADDKEMWGSIKGSIYGADQNSMWETNKASIEGTPFKYLMHQFFVEQRKKGWKLIND